MEKYSGLPIQMREDYSFIFEGGLAPARTLRREFSAMKNFLQDPGAHYERRDVYHVYRGLARPEHAEEINAAGLQYDLTVIPPGKIGREFAKTAGHYHPLKPGTAARYPEVYEVVYGRLFLIIQSASDDLERLREVYLVEAEKGEKILIPPGFGHVSINPGDDVLVLSNWKARDMEGLYEPYEARAGAAYYVLESERLGATGETSAGFEFAANLHYNQVPQLRHVRARELPQYDLRAALPLYYTGVKNLAALRFLTAPEEYVDELVPVKLFMFL